ncbi:hypothetical protein CFP71_31900 [Amycolatopsis thailandensis]|uniref:Uncharacterized protein n=1 Tax=Amycolatopsis thailandensis TaxID=589330 RepID=A0A229RQG7_9PSEU|nr:hypothetical protein [Amycolatopsis thailandensis]OXM48644.1 hypothetical protein CFP71_31900 [Amycolatopsis thailandensis]
MKWLMRSGATAGWLAASAALVVGTANLEPEHGERAVDAFGYTVVALACVTLAGVRRWPTATAATEAFALLVYLGFGYPTRSCAAVATRSTPVSPPRVSTGGPSPGSLES